MLCVQLCVTESALHSIICAMGRTSEMVSCFCRKMLIGIQISEWKGAYNRTKLIWNLTAL